MLDPSTISTASCRKSRAAPAGCRVLAASFGARNPQNVLQYVRVAGRDELYLLPVFVGREWELVAEGVKP